MRAALRALRGLVERVCVCVRMHGRVCACARARSGEQRSFARLSELMSDDLPTYVVHIRQPQGWNAVGAASSEHRVNTRGFEYKEYLKVPPYAVEYRGVRPRGAGRKTRKRSWRLGVPTLG